MINKILNYNIIFIYLLFTYWEKNNIYEGIKKQ